MLTLSIQIYIEDDMQQLSLKGVMGGVCLNVDYTMFGLLVYNIQHLLNTKSTSTKDNKSLQSTTNNKQIYTLFISNKTHH